MDVVCQVCSVTFQVKPSWAESRKVCSRKCLSKLYQTRMTGKSNPNYRGRPAQLQCEWCKKSFDTHSMTRRFCSKKCLAEWQSRAFTGEKSSRWRGGRVATMQRIKSTTKTTVTKRHPAGENRVCKVCNKPFVKKGCVYHKECRPFSGRVETISCKSCGKTMEVWSKRSRVYCKSCCRKGNKNSNWKGGIRTTNSTIRASDEYKQWRTSVFERDNYTCTDCEQVGNELHAHHVKSFSKYPSIRFSVSNGKTLCRDCHSKLHPMLVSKVVGG